MNSAEVVREGTKAKTARGRQTLRRFFSFPALLGTLLIFVVFIGTRLLVGYVADEWWQVAVGQHILATGHVPTVDIYSFTARGDHWITYEWLAEVVMGWVAQVGGLRGLTAVLVVLSGGLVLLVYYYAYQESRSLKAAFGATAVLMPLIIPFLNLRPQLIGYVFLVVTLICLERFRQGRRRAIWFLPLLFLVWVNTHGSFLVGLIFLGLYWVAGLVQLESGAVVAKAWSGKERRQLLLVLLFSVLVLPLTPYGTRLAAYPLTMSLSQPLNMAINTEWWPMNPASDLGELFLLMVAIALLAQLLSPAKHRLESVLLLLAAVVATTLHIRMLIVFAIVFAPWLARVLAPWVKPYRPEIDPYRLNAALMLLIAFGLLKWFPSEARLEQVVAETYPQAALQYLEQHPELDPMLNDYKLGGYLIWKRGPRHPVFIDGRADLYEHAGVLQDYLAIVNFSPQSSFLLRKYGVRSWILPAQSPLVEHLEADASWRRVYHDPVSAIYVYQASAPISPPGQLGPAR